MKTTIRYLVAVAALLAPAWGMISAQTPPLRSEGRILLLDTHRCLEGKIAQQGDQYRVRRTVGELWLPAKRVKYVCNTWEEMLGFMRARANLNDPDERLRLARWLNDNGQFEMALQEVNYALKLRPDHYPSLHLQRLVQKSADIANRAPVQTVAQSALPPAPSLDLSAETMRVFVTRVQPVLMNTCARCHAGNDGGKFQLKRVYGSGAASRRLTKYNLATVVEQIDLERPSLSPLLIKAVSAHGTASKEPIKSRGSAPYQILQDWVAGTITDNPHLKDLRHFARNKSASPNQAVANNTTAKALFASASTSNARPSSNFAAPKVLPKFSGPVPTVQPKGNPFSEKVRPATRFGTDAREHVRPALFTRPQTNPIANGTPPATPRLIPTQPVAAAAPGGQMNPPQPRQIPRRPISPAELAPDQQSMQPVDEFDPVIFNRQMHPGRVTRPAK